MSGCTGAALHSWQIRLSRIHGADPDELLLLFVLLSNPTFYSQGKEELCLHQKKKKKMEIMCSKAMSPWAKSPHPRPPPVFLGWLKLRPAQEVGVKNFKTTTNSPKNPTRNSGLHVLAAPAAKPWHSRGFQMMELLPVCPGDRDLRRGQPRDEQSDAVEIPGLSGLGFWRPLDFVWCSPELHHCNPCL